MLPWQSPNSSREGEMRHRSLPLVRVPNELRGLIREHVSLQDVTLLHIGGVADYYARVDSLPELQQVHRVALASNLPVLVLGSGAHVIIADFGFPGMVIHNRTREILTIPETAQMIVASGVAWRDVALQAAQIGFGGLEQLADTPGTVGGTLASNLSFSAIQPWSLVRSVTLITSTGQTHQLHRRAPGQLAIEPGQIILSVTLQCAHRRSEEVRRQLGQIVHRFDRFLRSGQCWLGPIFHDLAAADLEATFRRAEIFQLHQNGSRFSRDRLNFIILERRTTARDLRYLISAAADRLHQLVSGPVRVQISFAGRWEGMEFYQSESLA